MITLVRGDFRRTCSRISNPSISSMRISVTTMSKVFRWMRSRAFLGSSKTSTSQPILAKAGLSLLPTLECLRLYHHRGAIGLNPRIGKLIDEGYPYPAGKGLVLQALEGVGHGFELAIPRCFHNGLDRLVRVDPGKADHHVVDGGVRLIDTICVKRPAPAKPLPAFQKSRHLFKGRGLPGRDLTGKFLWVRKDPDLEHMRDAPDVQMGRKAAADHIVLQKDGQSGFLDVGQVSGGVIGRYAERGWRLIHSL